MSNIWCLQITNYEDDYKHRYDNGVYPEEPKLFKLKSNLDKYLNNYIYDAINQYINEYGITKFDESIEKYIQSYKIEESQYLPIDEIYKDNYVVLKLLHENLMQGEFIDYKFDWNISEVEFYDD